MWLYVGSGARPNWEVKGQPAHFNKVYGMTAAEGTGSTWAEYVVISANEVPLKPTSLDLTESASVPMSALTAWQAIFVKAGVMEPYLPTTAGIPGSIRTSKQKPPLKLLVTGASGAFGIYIVQLGSPAGLHVVAASTSKARNEDFLKSIGADEVVEYSELGATSREYNFIIDTVGGSILESCWPLVTGNGSLITIDSSSFDFVEKHRRMPFSAGKEKVNALFLIVETSGPQLKQLKLQ